MYPNQPNHPNPGNTGWHAAQPPIPATTASDKKITILIAIASLAAVLALAGLIVGLTNGGGNSAGGAAPPTQEQRDETACDVALAAIIAKTDGGNASSSGRKANDQGLVASGQAAYISAVSAVEQAIGEVSPKLQVAFAEWVSFQRRFSAAAAGLRGADADAADAKLKAACN